MDIYENIKINNMEMDDKIYFNSGDIVEIRHDISNKPDSMLVIEKIVRSYVKELNKENQLLGIKCLYFSKDGVMHEGIFNTKDLRHLSNKK